jgi:hypothetical protein
VHINTRLLEYEPDKIRMIHWQDSDINSISVKYSADSNTLCMAANILGNFIFSECIVIETDEWNGTDGLWHDLSFELVGNTLLGLRDDKILFECVNDSLLSITKTGELYIIGGNAQLCFDDISITSLVSEPILCGDANGDTDVNVSDAVSIINYIFAGGNPPDPLEAGDTNCDGTVNVSDAVWIINYVFTGGNPPCDTNGDSLPDC